jgi:hypothetical protein
VICHVQHIIQVLLHFEHITGCPNTELQSITTVH